MDKSRAVFSLLTLFPVSDIWNSEEDKAIKNGEIIGGKEPGSLFNCMEQRPCKPTLDLEMSKK